MSPDAAAERGLASGRSSMSGQSCGKEASWERVELPRLASRVEGNFSKAVGGLVGTTKVEEGGEKGGREK